MVIDIVVMGVAIVAVAGLLHVAWALIRKPHGVGFTQSSEEAEAERREIRRRRVEAE